MYLWMGVVNCVGLWFLKVWFPRPAVECEDLLVMHILGPTPDLENLETWAGAQQSVFSQTSHDSDAY